MDRILVGLSLVVVGCVIPPQSQQQPLPWGPQQAATTPAVADSEVAYPEEAEAADYEDADYEADHDVVYTENVYAEAPAASSAVAGRWVSTEWATVTNAAYASADFYLDITVASDGSFSGSWARFVCLTGAYGILSCSLNNIEGSASGRLDADGTGTIDLDRLGRSQLAWSYQTDGIHIQLPSNWAGENVLFRSTIKR